MEPRLLARFCAEDRTSLLFYWVQVVDMGKSFEARVFDLRKEIYSYVNE